MTNVASIDVADLAIDPFPRDDRWMDSNPTDAARTLAAIRADAVAAERIANGPWAACTTCCDPGPDPCPDE